MYCMCVCLCASFSRLLDGDNDTVGPDGASSFNVFKQRKFKLQPVQRICQKYPVVPQCKRKTKPRDTGDTNVFRVTYHTAHVHAYSHSHV